MNFQTAPLIMTTLHIKTHFSIIIPVTKVGFMYVFVCWKCIGVRIYLYMCNVHLHTVTRDEYNL